MVPPHDPESGGSASGGPSAEGGEPFGRLLRRAAEGDEAAWRSVVAAFLPRVYGLVRSQCGDPDLAEEITQGTFCTMAEKLDSYVEAGKFEAWIFRIAMNRLRDEMRRRARHARPMATEAFAGCADAPREDAPAEAERRAALREALARLSPADQRVIHLRHHAELSFREIAELLEEPLGTLLARHHRALRKLREMLGDPEGGPR